MAKKKATKRTGRKRKTGVRNKARRKTTKKATKRNTRKKSTKASRSRAAKKAAATRKRKKTARSKAAKKAAKTRAKKKCVRKVGAKKAAKTRKKKKRRNPGKKPTAKQLAARKKFAEMVRAKAAAKKRKKKKTKRNPAGLSAPAGSVPQYRKKKKAVRPVRPKRKTAKGTGPARRTRAIKGLITPEKWAAAQRSTIAALEAAEKKCDRALLKMRAKQAVTKTEVAALKAALAKSERTIKAFEKTIARLEEAPRAKAKATLRRLKTRQKETAQIVKRTTQYYNTKNRKGQPVKRVRKGGKSKVGTKTRKRVCPPKTRRPGAKLRAGSSAGGRAVAYDRWCGGVKTTTVKRNFWNLKEELI